MKAVRYALLCLITATSIASADQADHKENGASGGDSKKSDAGSKRTGEKKPPPRKIEGPDTIKSPVDQKQHRCDPNDLFVPGDPSKEPQTEVANKAPDATRGVHGVNGVASFLGSVIGGWCSYTLVESNNKIFALTAAHCFQDQYKGTVNNKEFQYVTADVGASPKNGKSFHSVTSNVHIHPNAPAQDIALVELDPKVTSDPEFQKIKKFKFASEVPKPDEVVLAHSQRTGHVYPAVVAKEWNDGYRKHPYYFDWDVVNAKTREGKQMKLPVELCRKKGNPSGLIGGDSGSPLTNQKGEIVGVLAHNFRAAGESQGHFTGYTLVDDWVRQTVNGGGSGFPDSKEGAPNKEGSPSKEGAPGKEATPKGKDSSPEPSPEPAPESSPNREATPRKNPDPHGGGGGPGKYGRPNKNDDKPGRPAPMPNAPVSPKNKASKEKLRAFLKQLLELLDEPESGSSDPLIEKEPVL